MRMVITAASPATLRCELPTLLLSMSMLRPEPQTAEPPSDLGELIRSRLPCRVSNRPAHHPGESACAVVEKYDCSPSWVRMWMIRLVCDRSPPRDHQSDTSGCQFFASFQQCILCLSLCFAQALRFSRFLTSVADAVLDISRVLLRLWVPRRLSQPQHRAALVLLIIYGGMLFQVCESVQRPEARMVQHTSGLSSSSSSQPFPFISGSEVPLAELRRVPTPCHSRASPNQWAQPSRQEAGSCRPASRGPRLRARAAARHSLSSPR